MSELQTQTQEGVITRLLTSIPRVYDEAGVAKGGSLFQPIAMSSDPASVAHLRLDHHDRDGTVGDMLSVLQNANTMFAHLAGNEGDTWEEREGAVRRESEEKVFLSALPVWLLAILFRRHGSSRPDGAWILAVSWLRSVSLMSKEKSAAVPSLNWD